MRTELIPACLLLVVAGAVPALAQGTSSLFPRSSVAAGGLFGPRQVVSLNPNSSQYTSRGLNPSYRSPAPPQVAGPVGTGWNTLQAINSYQNAVTNQAAAAQTAADQRAYNQMATIRAAGNNQVAAIQAASADQTAAIAAASAQQAAAIQAAANTQAAAVDNLAVLQAAVAIPSPSGQVVPPASLTPGPSPGQPLGPGTTNGPGIMNGTGVNAPLPGAGPTAPPVAPLSGLRTTPLPPQMQVGFAAATSPDRSAIALANLIARSPHIQKRSPITVTVENGKAILRGRVATEHDRALAGSMASLEPSFSQVVNEIEVEPRVAGGPVRR